MPILGPEILSRARDGASARCCACRQSSRERAAHSGSCHFSQINAQHDAMAATRIPNHICEETGKGVSAVKPVDLLPAQFPQNSSERPNSRSFPANSRHITPLFLV